MTQAAHSPQLGSGQRVEDDDDVLLVALGTLGAVADGCSYNLLLAFASDAVNSLGRAHGAAAQQQGGATTTSDGARFVHDVDKVRSLVVLTIIDRCVHDRFGCFDSLFFLDAVVPEFRLPGARGLAGGVPGQVAA